MIQKKVEVTSWVALVVILVLSGCGSPAVTVTNTQVAPTSTRVSPTDTSISPTITPVPATPTVTPSNTPAPLPTTSGLMETPEIWDGEIHITGDLIITTTLTIKPGTRIIMDSYSDDRHWGSGYTDDWIRQHNDPTGIDTYQQNSIKIDAREGKLIAIGEPDNPIIFMSDDPLNGAGSWAGLWMGNGELAYVIIQDGHSNLSLTGPTHVHHSMFLNGFWLGIDIYSRRANVHDNYVNGGGHHCLNLFDSATIEHNVLANCSTGIGIETAGQVIIRNNITIDAATAIQFRREIINAEIMNNTFAIVNGPPAGWYFQGKKVYPANRDLDAWGGYSPKGEIWLINNIFYQYKGFGTRLLSERSNYNLGWTQSGKEHFVRHFDPKFLNPMEVDFHLSQDSLAIDAGSPEILDWDNSPSDLGAFGGPEGNWMPIFPDLSAIQ